MLVALFALVGLLAFASLGVDAGLVWAARTQLQNATDAAALAGVANLIQVDPPAVTELDARGAATVLAGAHRAVHAASLALEEDDLEIGSWDLEERQFTPLPGEVDPFRVNAVRVTARLDEEENGPVPAFLARVVGRQSFDVRTEAVAYLGFAGSAPPGAIDLPIAVHCCRLEGPGCEEDYCTTIETPPGQCLSFPELGHLRGAGEPQAADDPSGSGLSCIVFNPEGFQNGCWTGFSDPNPNANYLRELVANGNVSDVDVGDVISLLNGDATDVLREVATRFDLEGEDRYPPLDGAKDSWVVKLPVVECPGGDNSCTHALEITGFVCFEIRQVVATPRNDAVIRGRFLCAERDSNLFEDCAIGGSSPGGDPDFGVRADLPVLVH